MEKTSRDDDRAAPEETGKKRVRYTSETKGNVKTEIGSTFYDRKREREEEPPKCKDAIKKLDSQ